ncbi:MAG: PQQ-binding-like beta-propeller repeat protein, partial [Methanoregula sp.]
VRLFNRTGAQLWEQKNPGLVLDVEISRDGDKIIVGAPGGIYVFNRTGNLLWQYETPTSVMHVSAAYDGTYFTAGTNNTVYVFNPWEPAPTNPTLTPPATFPVQQPTTNPLPVPSWLAIVAICCTGIGVRIQRRD